MIIQPGLIFSKVIHLERDVSGVILHYTNTMKWNHENSKIKFPNQNILATEVPLDRLWTLIGNAL